jgi:large subunit ribosomal protein L7/L12
VATKTSTEDWIEELKGISVLELSERIKALEEEFGVSATAVAAAAPAATGGEGDGAGAEEEFGVSATAVAAAAPAAAGDGDGDGGEEESSTVDVMLTDIGDQKIQVIKVIRAATGLGIKEAKAVADEAPTAVKEGVEREEADKLKAELEEAGATVELK